MKVKENNKNKLKYSFDKARRSNSPFNFEEVWKQNIPINPLPRIGEVM